MTSDFSFNQIPHCPGDIWQAKDKFGILRWVLRTFDGTAFFGRKEDAMLWRKTHMNLIPLSMLSRSYLIRAASEYRPGLSNQSVIDRAISLADADLQSAQIYSSSSIDRLLIVADLKGVRAELDRQKDAIMAVCTTDIHLAPRWSGNTVCGRPVDSRSTYIIGNVTCEACRQSINRVDHDTLLSMGCLDETPAKPKLSDNEFEATTVARLAAILQKFPGHYSVRAYESDPQCIVVEDLERPLGQQEVAVICTNAGRRPGGRGS